MEKVIPDLYKDREAMIEEQCELQKRVALLRMYGPRTMEDLELFYFLITGQIRVGDNAIWNWENWYPKEEMDKSFVSGIFSIRRWITGARPGKPSGRYDVADPQNNKYSKFLGQLPDSNTNAWSNARNKDRIDLASNSQVIPAFSGRGVLAGPSTR